MKNFTYYQPASVAQALGLLDKTWGKAELLAGGTDLLDLQKEYVAQPDKVVSLTGIPELRKIEIKRQDNGSTVISIGAGVKLAEIAEHAELRKLVRGLTMAASEIGGPQIRNMGTLGGNLCQRNRCWYFRDEEVKCLLKGGEKCFAMDGDNRYHSVFTQGHKCVMVNPSTLAPALLTLGCAVKFQAAPGNTQSKDLREFFQAPSSADQREHTLAPNQILTAVELTIPPGLASGSYEVRHKQSYDWPLVQAAVSFALKDGKADNPVVALGHVAPTPLRADGAAEALRGKPVTEETATAAGKAAAQGAKPLSGNEYKVKLIEVAVKRAVLTAAGMKPYWEV
jgi:xanthine dehydrogenase YagS FAD-binding subunit